MSRKTRKRGRRRLLVIVVLLALIVFVRKFKLYGDLADKVHAYIVDREHKRTDGESI